MDDEQEWEFNDGEPEMDSILTLNLPQLSEALQSVPLHLRLGLSEDHFKVHQLKTYMNHLRGNPELHALKAAQSEVFSKLSHFLNFSANVIK